MHSLRTALVRAPSAARIVAPRRFICIAIHRRCTPPQAQWKWLQPRFSSSSADAAATEAAVDAADSAVASNTAAEVAAGEDESESNFAAELNPNGTPGHTLFVGNIYFGASEDALRQVFSRYGAVEQVKMITDARGLSKGYAFVTMADPAPAAKAREELNGRFLHGRPLGVAWPTKQVKDRNTQESYMNSPPSNSLYVGNLSYEMTDEDLQNVFTTLEGCVDVRVAVDRRTGQPRGFAHADFVDVESASAAKGILGKKQYYGRFLRVDFAKPATYKPGDLATELAGGKTPTPRTVPNS